MEIIYKYVEIFKDNYMCHSRAAFRYSLYYRFSVLAVNIETQYIDYECIPHDHLSFLYI